MRIAMTLGLGKTNINNFNSNHNQLNVFISFLM